MDFKTVRNCCIDFERQYYVIETDWVWFQVVNYNNSSESSAFLFDGQTGWVTLDR